MNFSLAGVGAEVGPCQTVCGPAYRPTAALAADTASSAARTDPPEDIRPAKLSA
jgi:hypothetical protein